MISIFFNKLLNLLHKFFAPSMFHKKIVDSRGVIYIGHLTRFSSIMIDLIIYILVLYSIATFINTVFDFHISLETLERYKLGLEIGSDAQHNINMYITVVLFSQIIQFILIACTNIFMWHKYGFTPAKFITGVIILDEKTLMLPSLKQSIKRFLALVVSVLPLFLGIIWVIFDKKGQAWHDKIAGTIVVARSSLENRKFT